MDRRSFLKRTFAASMLGALALGINECKAISRLTKSKSEPSVTDKALPNGKKGWTATDRMIFGGGLFNGYAHNRDSVDGANLRLLRTRLSQTRFLAGWG